MIKDLKQFLKFYQTYKKGKNDMEKTKDWIVNHNKEIFIAIGIIAAYQIGFKRGFKKGMKFELALVNLATKGGK